MKTDRIVVQRENCEAGENKLNDDTTSNMHSTKSDVSSLPALVEVILLRLCCCAKVGLEDEAERSKTYDWVKFRVDCRKGRVYEGDCSQEGPQSASTDCARKQISFIESSRKKKKKPAEIQSAKGRHCVFDPMPGIQVGFHVNQNHA